MAARHHRIAVIPGDGIGKEVMPEGVRVLEKAAALYGFSLPRLAGGPARTTSTVFATPLVVPYLLSYDIVALAVAAVLWVDHSRFSPAQRIGLIVLVSMPLLMPILGMVGLPIAPLVILLAWLALLHQEGALPRLTRHPTPSTP